MLGDGDGLADALADALGVASAEGAVDAVALTSGEGTAATAGGVDPPPDARRYTPPPRATISRTKATDRNRRSKRGRLVIARSM